MEEQRLGDAAQQLHRQVIEDLRAAVRHEAEAIAAVARALADVDVSSALALAARVQGLTRPEMRTDTTFEVVHGRHPVVAAARTDVEFVTNDCTLTEQRHWLITGPNMGGKSTFLRQNALMVIMAQMGSFVPAQRAVIGLADRVFARIGSGDNLAENQSTFMVEMTDIAHILHHATSRSFVILDEVGRGTSPVDGLALAAAITQHLHDHTQCRTLSATHLLHLTRLCKHLTGYIVLVCGLRSRS